MNDNVKILKGILLTIIIVPIIIIALWYIWLLYEGSKLDNYTFTEEMKNELMVVANIHESTSFNPIAIQFNDVAGPGYYSNYELKFEISKEDFENNKLSYSENEVYNSFKHLLNHLSLSNITLKKSYSSKMVSRSALSLLFCCRTSNIT